MRNAYVESRDYSPEGIARNETLFTVANGTLGLRGDFEEREGSVHKGTYINGFFDTEPIAYGESAYGYAENHETILNLPDPKRIELSVNGHPFSVKAGKIEDFLMRLDLEGGTMTRSLRWTAPGGIEIGLRATRVVPLDRPWAAAIQYSVTALNRGAKVVLTSMIDGTAKNLGAEEDPRVGSKFTAPPLKVRAMGGEGGTLFFQAETRNSGLPLAGRAVHHAWVSGPGGEKPSEPTPKSGSGEGKAWAEWSVTLQEGGSITLEKYIAYERGAKGESRSVLDGAASLHAAELAAEGFDALLASQSRILGEFWKTAALEIDGDSESERAIHFNLFHLLQSAGRDGRTSIAAKGLTAEGYEGHFFWDTEAYVCPVFTYLQPEIARSLLEYRRFILPAARRRARVMSLQGALYPWRTIDGEETSAYYPAGTAQYHIDADIVFALRKYLTARSPAADADPLEGSEFDPAATCEMAVETARMWMSLGSRIPSKGGAFCINEVTGPDEYSACVNNNTYTNLMARENLRFAAEVAEAAARRGWERFPLSVSPEEIASWKAAAESMYVPYDPSTGIYPQDDSFMDRAEWDFAGTPRDKYPLLLHFHPLVIYRHRVLKQPDLVLAQFLLSGEFTAAEKRRNFAFYERLTTGDSSLSHCIQSIMACEGGDTAKAESYFDKTARMDLEDVHGNTRDGIHTAAMAGSWMSVVYGFAGFRDWRGQWRFSPSLPRRWQRLSFRLCLGDSLLGVELTRDRARYSLAEGGPLELIHRNERFTLEPGGSREFSLLPSLKAVLFDLDGVVTDTAGLHYQAWKELADERGLRFDREVNEALRGVSRMESLEIILRHNGLELDGAERKVLADRKNRRYVELLGTLTEENILPGIRELLGTLRSRGIKLALASSSRNAPYVLERLGLSSAFDAVADAERIPMAKPEPDLFLEAAALLGVWPSDCAAVEDAQAGIDAIAAAGMRSVAVGEGLSGADASVPGTGSLTVSLLESLFPGA